MNFLKRIKTFSKNYTAFSKVIKEKLSDLDYGKKQSLMEELEALNKKIEKMLKSL